MRARLLLSWSLASAACYPAYDIADPDVSATPLAFASEPDGTVVEGATLLYVPRCDDLIQVDDDDTCGATFVDGTYRLTPSEAAAPGTCELVLTCGAGERQVEQRRAITLVEEAAKPRFVGSMSSTTHVGMHGSYTIGVVDDDLPAQSLALSLSDDCPFDVTLDERVASYACGASPSSCDVSITVEDDSPERLGASDTLHIVCANAAPTVSRVTVEPVDPRAGETLVCAYVYADADGDADASTVAWFVDDAPVDGTTIVAPSEGHAVRCEVHESDGISDGVTVASELVVVGAPVVSALASTGDVTCAARRDASVVCWGGAYGGVTEVGLDDVTALAAWGDVFCGSGTQGFGCWSAPAIEVSTLDYLGRIDVLATGDQAMCVLGANGFHCIGNNAHGQLGAGDFAAHNLEVPTPLGMGSDVVAVTMGRAHACAVQSGRVKCWGANAEGQLGDGSASDQPSPRLVDGPTNVTAVAASDTATCALAAGKLWCWGRSPIFGDLQQPSQVPWSGDASALWMGADGRVCTASAEKLQCSDVGEVALTVPGALSIGSRTACAARPRDVACWGDNRGGGLGRAPLPALVAPTTVAHDVDSLVAGPQAFCALTGDGPRCWGALKGALYAAPTTLGGVPADIDALALGDINGCWIDDGAVRCWGTGSGAAIVTGATAIAVGKNARACAAVGGQLACWQGAGPAQVDGFVGVVGAFAMRDTACAVDVPDHTLCWDPNDLTGDRMMAPVGGAPSALSVGPERTCAIVSGAVRCWGQTFLGQGTNAASSEAVAAVHLGFGVTAIAVAREATCAVKGGVLYCWGGDDTGLILGQGAVYEPIVIDLGQPVLDVAAAEATMCALLQDASVMCWGATTDGVAGIGGVLVAQEPLPVDGFPGATP